MYEAVHAHPDGESTAARFAQTAVEYGFEGVVVRARDASPDYQALRERYAIDVVDGVEIRADTPEQAGGAIGNYRPKHTLVLVEGGTNRLNRFAVEQERVDVLTRPMDGNGDFNHVLAKAARDNEVHVEFNLAPVLQTSGGPRVQALKDLRKLRELVEHYDTPYVVSANPASHLQLRAPRDLQAVGEQVGFDADQIEQGLRAWRDIAQRNRERMSEEFIAPGVKRGPYEEES